ncbi:hypothetical protein SOVF_057430, partial [Spinacia oleracea]
GIPECCKLKFLQSRKYRPFAAPTDVQAHSRTPHADFLA